MEHSARACDRKQRRRPRITRISRKEEGQQTIASIGESKCRGSLVSKLCLGTRERRDVPTLSKDPTMKGDSTQPLQGSIGRLLRLPGWSRFVPLVLFLACWGPTALAQNAQDGEPGGQYKQWLNYYKQVAKEYTIRLDGDDAPLKLRPGPLHIYHHPDGAGLQEQFGATFVWLKEGRPEAFVSLWSYPTNKINRRAIVREFHSLSLSTLTTVRKERTFWSPQEPGLEFKPIPGAPPPAKTAGLRLAQMRALSRQFTGYLRLGKNIKLRISQQPVYRYNMKNAAKDRPAVLDGAVFLLMTRWDPEIILVIECRSTQKGYSWQFAGARFSCAAVRLEHGGKTLWSVREIPYQNFHCGAAHKPFYAVHSVDIHEIPIE